MKTVFIDTNVLLDIILKRKGWFDAVKLLDMSSSTLSFHISALTMANMAYIMRKALGKETLYDQLERMSQKLQVESLSTKAVEQAIALRANDFEDALQYYCAMENKCDCIVTNNKKDFIYSSIPVLTPKEYLCEFSQPL
ncbi:MAG: PIN domain-containing protein [Paludibacteraceae bacterium]|nr:PIN domain-containing protein [Paludibacteraceae bacterium]